VYRCSNYDGPWLRADRASSKPQVESMKKSVVESFERPRALLAVRGLLPVLVCALSFACRSTADGASADGAAAGAPAREPQRFSFTLPSAYARLELRGEGSEHLSAPAGAAVRPKGKVFEVTSGDDFALEVAPDALALAELGAGGVAPILREPDLLVFAAGSGYSFVVVRELVPEWDESTRQRFACGSAGGAVSQGATRADARAFSKAAIENMVAACRSLELPKLE